MRACIDKLGDAFSVLIEGVCAKLKPDWVKLSHIGMQLLICSHGEQEKHNDESLPLPLALQSFFENKDELAAHLMRRASVVLKIAEDMCSGPERMTLTDYGLTSSGLALALRTRSQPHIERPLLPRRAEKHGRGHKPKLDTSCVEEA